MDPKEVLYIIIGVIILASFYFVAKLIKKSSLNQKSQEPIKAKQTGFHVNFIENPLMLIPLSSAEYHKMLVHYGVKDEQFRIYYTSARGACTVQYSWFLELFYKCILSSIRSYHALSELEEYFKELQQQSKSITRLAQEITEKLNKRQLTMLFSSDILIQNCLDRYSENRKKIVEYVFDEWQEFTYSASFFKKLETLVEENREIVLALENFLKLSEQLYQAQFSGNETDPLKLTPSKNLQRVIDKCEDVLNSTTEKTE